MSSHEYDCITFYDLMLKIEGYNDKRKDELTRQRLCAFFAYIAPHVKLKKNTRPTDLYKLPWDEENETGKTTLEQKKDGFKDLINIVTKKDGKVRD